MPGVSYPGDQTGLVPTAVSQYAPSKIEFRSVVKHFEPLIQNDDADNRYHHNEFVMNG
jgi:hypothetical protein